MNIFNQYYLIIIVLIILGSIFTQLYIKKMGTKINLVRFLWEQLILEPIVAIFRWIPGGWGIGVRILLYKLLLKKMGKNVVIRDGVRIDFPENLEIGDYSGINRDCFIEAGASVIIGKWVRISPCVSILTMNHNFEKMDVPIKQQGLTKKPVTIDDDVWVGYNSIILPGVTVRKGAVIAAGSVVTKDVDEYSVIGGVPARLIKYRRNRKDE